jgi:hypothetical protein
MNHRLREAREKLASLFWKKRLDLDLEAELTSHLDLAAAENGGKA